MKKNLLLTFLLAYLVNFGQSPQGMNYQAVVRDNSGNVIVNHNAGVKFIIHQGSITGSSVYAETQTPVSDAFGRIAVVIGQGTVVSGSFSSINWSTGPYFNEILIDASGGTNYLSMGGSQLWSVPYALYAEKANEQQILSISGNTLSISSGNSVTLPNNGNGGSVNLVGQQIPVYDLPANPILRATCSSIDGSIFIASLEDGSNTGTSYLVRMERGASGDYYVTNYTVGGINGDIRSIAIIDTFVYYEYIGGVNGGVSRVNLSNLSNQTSMTFNPAVSSIGGIFTDGTNLFMYTTNYVYATYQIISTALINSNANFTLSDNAGGYIAGTNAFDGNNYYFEQQNTNIIFVYGPTKNYVTQYNPNINFGGTGDCIINYSSAKLAHVTAIPGVGWINSSAQAIPVIVTKPFSK